MSMEYIVRWSGASWREDPPPQMARAVPAASSRSRAFSQADLIVRQLQTRAQTVDELCVSTGLSCGKVRQSVQYLRREHRIVVVRVTQRTSNTGRPPAVYGVPVPE